MTMTMSRTGWTLGDAEELSSRAEALSSRHTPVRDVADSSLGNVLEAFDASFSSPFAVLGLLHSGRRRSTGTIDNADRWLQSLELVLTEQLKTFELWTSTETADSASGSIDSPFVESLDAAEVIERLSAQLGLPVRDVCQAAGVSKSAFYTWTKPGGPRPRVASQGRLWGLVQFSDDLFELLSGSAPAWLSDAGRRRLFISGRFDDLLESVQSYADTEQTTTPQHARLLYVGADRLASDTEPSAPRGRAPRPVRVVAAVPRRRQQ
jgi:hypothetical protein